MVKNSIPMLVWNNINWIKFNLNIGNYQNIITFFSENNIYFLTEMIIDFTNIPIILHGNGVSENLLEYISNNTDNNLLILNFLNYFFDSIIDIRYSTGEKFYYNIYESTTWQDATFVAYESYISTTTTTTTASTTTTTTTTISPIDIIRKGPYLIYENINTEMSIKWQNSGTSTDSIVWGTTTDYLDGTTIVNEYGENQHKYTITGLTIDTKYYYKININGVYHIGSFFSAKNESSTTLKFLAYGDNRTNVSIHNSVADQMLSTYPEYQSLVMNVGDLITDGSQDTKYGNYWDNEIFSQTQLNIKNLLSSSPYMTTVGNHDLGNNNYEKYFRTDRYYTFIYGPAQFFILDQYVNFESGSTQYNWFVSELSTSTKTWKVVFFHQPGWSAGTHENNTTIQNDYEPLFEQYNVKIVFSGHNHYYSRAIVNNYGLDVTHITTGGGGAPLYSPNLTYPNIITGSSEYHFCKISINGNTMIVDVINLSGTIIDSFTVNL